MLSDYFVNENIRKEQGMKLRGWYYETWGALSRFRMIHQTYGLMETFGHPEIEIVLRLEVFVDVPIFHWRTDNERQVGS